MKKSRLTKYFLTFCMIGAASGIAYYQFNSRSAQLGAQEEARECGSCTRRHTSMTRAIEARNQNKVLEKSIKDLD